MPGVSKCLTRAGVFFTFYEPKSKRTYCFEGDPHKAAAFVPMPTGAKGADHDMRMQVVELIWRAGRKNG